MPVWNAGADCKAVIAKNDNAMWKSGNTPMPI